MISQKTALRQFHEIEKLAGNLRLAADGWDEDWQTLIATLMSARTTDRVTIPIAEKLFKKYKAIKKLANSKLKELEEIIRGVNFYKTKARNIIELAKIIVSNYNGKIPHDFSKLIELPGVGRKTANVFLAEQGHDTIGIDTHVSWISQKMRWTKHSDQEKIEKDLENLFPKKYWGKLNWVLVRFGQTYKSRKEKARILGKIRKMK